jgi:excisionase family DNA binding protein
MKTTEEKAPSNKITPAKQPLDPSAGAYKLREACQYLGGVSQITVRRLIDRGLIKPNRALRHLLIPVSELDRFLAEGQK